jgi:hypothetical protein
MVLHLQIVIAFTYRRDKVLVGCKYREVSKKFSQVCCTALLRLRAYIVLLSILFILIFSSYQEPNTEKILYGLDDIKQVQDVIIVCSRYFPFFFVANPFKPLFTIFLLAFFPFWHCRLRVKLINFQWKRLDIVTV